MWQRLPTFLLTICQVINAQRQTWVDPAKDLAHRIEQELFTPAPTPADSSGLTAPPDSYYPWTRDRNVPPRLLKCPRRSA